MNSNKQADVVICGAGIAGVAAAYELAVKRGVQRVVLVDERPPLTLTSDKSTEAYRNWWGGPDDAMVRLMNRSIDLLEALADETDNRFLMNRRGYLYATADSRNIPAWLENGHRISAMGAGELRIHRGRADDPPYESSPLEGYHNAPSGADLFVDQTLIRHHFPWLSETTAAVLHARRCGWLSGQQLGMTLLEGARAHGAELIAGRVTAVEAQGGRVKAVRVAAAGTNQRIETRAFVNAAGPLVGEVGALLGVDLPVFSELHLKASFTDHLGAVPRHAPMFIWEDGQRLAWTAEEREMLAEEEAMRWLLGELPPGAHGRPEGHGQNQQVLLLWAYHTDHVAPCFPIPLDPDYAELALRGVATMVPALGRYIGRLPQVYLDGGYYTKTAENRPLIGPLAVDGAYIVGALSGYGLMAACGAAELLADYIVGAESPGYAAAFSLARYAKPAYQALLQNWGDYAGQL